MAISLKTKCLITGKPKELHITITEYEGEYVFVVCRKNEHQNIFLFSSDIAYSDRETAIDKLLFNLRAIKMSRNKEINGGILTDDHIVKIGNFLKEGNDSVDTSVLLS